LSGQARGKKPEKKGNSHAHRGKRPEKRPRNTPPDKQEKQIYQKKSCRKVVEKGGKTEKKTPLTSFNLRGAANRKDNRSVQKKSFLGRLSSKSGGGGGHGGGAPLLSKGAPPAGKKKVKGEKTP